RRKPARLVAAAFRRLRVMKPCASRARLLEFGRVLSNKQQTAQHLRSMVLADVMSLLFQPPPPPCVKCGTTTVIAPAFEEGQRVFVVRCPACGHSGTYSLNYSALREW